MIEVGVDVAQAGFGLLPSGNQVLVEERHDAGENRRRCRGAPDDRYVALIVDQVAVVVASGGKGNVGYVAGVVIGHAGAGLPGGFGEVGADAAAGGPDLAHTGGRVPGLFGNVRAGGDGSRTVAGVPVVARSFIEGGAAHAGNLGHGGEDIDVQSFGRQSGPPIVAARGAGIAGGDHPGDALRVGLLGQRAVGVGELQWLGGHLRGTRAEAHADDGGEVLVHRVFGGVDEDGGCDVYQRGIRRDPANHLQIEVGFAFGSVEARVGVTGDHHHLGVVLGKAEGGAGGLHIRHLDVGGADDGDRLARPRNADLIEGIDVVDGGKVAGRKVMGAVAGVGVERARLGFARAARQVVEAAEHGDHGRDGFRRPWLGGGAEVHPAIHQVAVDGGAKRVAHLLGGAAEADRSAGAGHVVDGESGCGEPAYDLVHVGLANAETVAELLRREPVVVLRRGGVLLIGEKPFDPGLLGGRAFEQKEQGTEAGGGVERPLVELGQRPGVGLAAEHGAAAGVDSPGNAAGLRHHGNRARDQKQRGNSEKVAHVETPPSPGPETWTPFIVPPITLDFQLRKCASRAGSAQAGGPAGGASYRSSSASPRAPAAAGPPESSHDRRADSAPGSRLRCAPVAPPACASPGRR